MSSDDKIKKLLSKLVFKSKLYLYLLKQKVFFKYIEALSLFMKKQIVIFISGKGSNALNIINYFSETENLTVSHVYSNNKTSPFFDHKLNSNIKVSYFQNDDLNAKVFEELQHIKPDLIVLAGFLKKIPISYLDYFKKMIINIHPSLLPKYGGKGMYGNYVHDAVIENKELFSGITIHKVNRNYDEGEVIFQKKIRLEQNESITSLAKKINNLEMKYFPEVVARLIN